MKSAKPAIIIFVRNPELGKVKTRIAKTEGDQKAYDIYVELLRHTRAEVSDLDVDRYLFYSEEIQSNDDWSTDLFIKKLQAQGDLGNKIKAAFATCAAEHDKVIIIGSDCASISTEHIQDAIDLLDKVDVVLGPTYDGGYYLLGANAFHSELFEDIDWSTEIVYSQTIDKIKKLGLTYNSLEILSDIDYIEDWDKWGW